jgi:hypothetical protein
MSQSNIKSGLWIDYTNYRGERDIRYITELSMIFEENEYHKPAQWLIKAYDSSKNAWRTFAVNDIHSMNSNKEKLKQ